MPDSVSVTRLDNLSSVVENQQFQLRCDITAVAPARHLVVRWFQGNKTVPLGGKGVQRAHNIDRSSSKTWVFKDNLSTSSESLHVTGCPSEKVPGCNVSTTRHPVNMSSTITVALDRSDSGTTFWCEAQLELGLEILPAVSSPLNITVNCEITFLLSFRIIILVYKWTIKKNLFHLCLFLFFNLPGIFSQQISPPSISLCFQR